MIQPERKTSIDDIKIVETRGPWASKSGGELNVLMALPQEVVAEFLDYYHPGFDTVQQRTGKNIRGLRVYNVNGIPKDSIGAMEWHDIRTEYVVALGGSAVWQCVDFDGKETEVVLDGKTSVIVPPGILHTYVALEDNTRLQVICNTLFDPEDPLTHDTYSKELFTRLQKSD